MNALSAPGAALFAQGSQGAPEAPLARGDSAAACLVASPEWRELAALELVLTLVSIEHDAIEPALVAGGEVTIDAPGVGPPISMASCRAP